MWGSFLVFLILRSSSKWRRYTLLPTTAVVRMIAICAVLGPSCYWYIDVSTAWPVLRCTRERSVIVWSLTTGAGAVGEAIQERWVPHESDAGIVIYYGVLLNIGHHLLSVREGISPTANYIRHRLGVRKMSSILKCLWNIQSDAIFFLSFATYW